MTVAPRRKLCNSLGISMSMWAAPVLNHKAAIGGVPLVHQVLLGIEGTLDLNSPVTYFMVGGGETEND